MTDRITIYIPAYNAATTLRRVLERIPETIKQRAEEILVVDNNSTDGTFSVVEEYMRTTGLEKLHIIRNPRNLGYGGSQKIAYRRCIERGIHCVVMLHGDGQYAPEHLEHLIDPVCRGEVDLMFGSRIKGQPLAGGMPLIRFVGNRGLTFIQNLVLGAHFSEYHSGYRVYLVEALRKIPFERLSSDYHFDTEIIILLLRYGFRIGERPIPTHYGDERCYINIWRYGLQVLMTTVSYALHQKGWRRSRSWERILSDSGEVQQNNPVGTLTKV